MAHEKHTPGPWRSIPDATFSSMANYDLRIAGADNVIPCIVFGGIRESEANARLIAAAPDLLAACEMIASFAQSWTPLSPGDIRQVKDAIAKATGAVDESRRQ